MLYDPKWEQEVKSDPLSLKSLIAWLERQPSNKKYCYISNGECLLGQYFTYCGFKNVIVCGWGRWSHTTGGTRVFVSGDPEFHRIAHGHPRTFAAALRRARNPHA